MDKELKDILVEISNGINYLEHDLEFIKDTNTEILFYKLDKIIELLDIKCKYSKYLKKNALINNLYKELDDIKEQIRLLKIENDSLKSHGIEVADGVS